MKKIAILALCAALMLVFSAGCVSVSVGGFYSGSVMGVGDLQRFEIKTGDIKEIRASAYLNIEYNAAASDAVILEIQPNLMEFVNVSETGGVLSVNSTHGIGWTIGREPKLTVYAPNLEKLSHSGAGTFTTNDAISGDSLTLNISGTTASTIALDVDKLDFDMSGASSTELHGRADAANIRMSGAGSIRALSLLTKDASVTLSGTGSVSIACSDNLSIDGSGLGSLEYKGSPSLDINRSGLVSISKVD